MSSLVGARVVRGPDWKWGDQDGGEGHTGTVIPTSDLDLDLLGPSPNLWDSGLKFTYQGGPEGSYDLRVSPSFKYIMLILIFTDSLISGENRS